MTRRTTTPRSYLGLSLMILGVLLLIVNLQPFSFSLNIWQLWPLALVIIGVFKIFSGSWGEAALLIVFGGGVSVAQFHPEIDIGDVWDQWPAFLVLAGIVMVLRSVVPRGKPKRRLSRSNSAVFSSQTVAPDDPNYRGGSAAAVLGTYNLELGRSALDAKGAVLEVFAFWGGINIDVPTGWAVDLQVIPLMGGAEDKTRPLGPTPEGAPRLLVRGFVWMAGLEIRN